MPQTRLRVLVALLAECLACVAGGAAAQTLPPAPQEITFTVKSFVVTGDNPVGDATAQEILAPYLGVQHGLSGLEAARRALDEGLRERGYSLYRVTLPPQETVDTIRLEVTRITVSEIQVSGEKYFSEANVMAGVPGLKVGESPNMKEVARELEIVNENPDKHVTLGLSEADDGTGLKADLETSDRDPWSLTLGYNNTGLDDQGGRSRLVGYLQYGNLFDLDQSLGVAYTTSPTRPNDVNQYGLYYKAPVYQWGGVVSASYSYSTVSTGALGNGTTVTGAGSVEGISYTEFLYPMGDYKSSVSLGLDDKEFRSPVIDGIRAPGGDVRSRPLVVTYVGTYQPDWGVATINLEYDKNLNSGAYNTDAAYAANRLDATRSWDAFRLFSSLTVPLPSHFAAAVIARGQYSADALIAGEQFGLGGSESIRGMEERAVTGDAGASVSLEVYTPEVYPNLRFLAFSDNGTLWRHDPAPGVTARENLNSLGVGLRWSFRHDAQVSADFGVITHGSTYPEVKDGSRRLHLNATYTF